MKRIMFLAVVVLAASASMAYAAGSITGRSIKDKSITGKDVKSKSLSVKHFKGSLRGPSGAAGSTGRPGANGTAGAAGPAGPAGTSAISDITVHDGTMPVPAGGIEGGTLLCPEGKRAISGGFGALTDDSVVFLSAANEDRTGWSVALDNSESAIEGEMGAQVLCAGAGEPGQAAQRTRSMSRPDAKLERLVEQRRMSQR